MESGAQREEDLFQAAAQLSSSARAEFLDRECRGDADLRQRLEALLAAYDATDSFMADSIEETAPAPHQLFGDYELLEQIARGGMGVVYRARHLALNRTVALKMVLGGRSATANMVQRFKSEAEAAARLDHPNIASIYEVGEHEGQPYFTMRFFEGGTLAQRMAEYQLPQSERRTPTDSPAGPLSNGPIQKSDCKASARKKQQQIAQCLATVASAVHHAHQRGILHRDIKPGNILLDQRGEPHVADFGLAKLLEGEGDLTQSQAVLGTPSYMAPEQAAGQTKQLATTTDIYGLGAILYELLAGRPPFRASSALETMRQVMEECPAAPRTLNRQVDRDLETICLKCLEKEPQHRYSSAEAMAQDLGRWSRNEPILARPSSYWERTAKWTRRRPAMAALVGVSGLAALALTGMLSVELSRRTETALRQKAQEALVKVQRAQEAEAEQRVRAEQAQAAEAQQRARAEQAQAAETAQRKRAEAESEKAMHNFYLASIAWADLHRQANNPDQANRVLEDCPSSQRNWEWHYLRSLCGSVPTQRHIPDIIATFAPSPTTVVSLSRDSYLSRWDNLGETAASRDRLSLWPLYHGAFSRDGLSLVGDGWDGDGEAKVVAVWNVTSGQEIFRASSPGEHDFSTAEVAISATGRLVAVSGRRLGNLSKYDVHVWEVGTDKPKRSVTVRSERVNSLEFSSDDRFLAWASVESSARPLGSEGTIWLLDLVPEKEPIRVMSNAALFLAIAFSPDGRWLAAGTSAGKVGLWQANNAGSFVNRDMSTTLTAHSEPVSCLTFSNDSTHLASGADDGTVSVWKVASGSRRQSFKGHSHKVRVLSFAPGDAILLSGGDDDLVKTWDLTKQRGPTVIKGHSRGLAFGPKGDVLTSGSSIWSALDGSLLAGSGTRPRAGRPAYTPDGLVVANGLSILEANSARQVQKLNWPDGTSTGAEDHPFYGVAISPDGKSLAVGKAEKQGKVTLLPLLSKGEEIRSLIGHRYPVWDVAFHPDGSLLASASGNWQSTGGAGEVTLWDLRSGEALQTCEGAFCFYSVAFSGDGRRFAGSGGIYHPGNKLTKRGQISVWDVATGVEVFSDATLPSCVYSIALNPDGTRLVAAVGAYGETSAFEVKLWDLETGREILTLGKHDKKVEAVAFSSNGKRIAAASVDHTIRIWSIE